jgi:hypothetical protein
MKRNELTSERHSNEVDVSSPEFRIPSLVTNLGRSALSYEVIVTQVDDEGVAIDVAWRSSRVEHETPSRSI